MNKIQFISSIVLVLQAFLLHLSTGESQLRGLEQDDEIQGDHTGENEGLLHNALHLLFLPVEIIYSVIYCALLGHSYLDPC